VDRLRVLSAGAAQAVVQKTIAAYEREAGVRVEAGYGAVGAMRARLVAGEPVDVILLTAAMIDELIAQSLVAPGTRADLGRVGTGVAVRAGVPLPALDGEAALRAALLAARCIACPDPQTATAGKIVMRMLERLGIAGEVGARLRHFPNGHATMRWLAEAGAAGDLGITQVTEILPHADVAYAGPLPDAFQMKTVYAAGLAARAANPAAGRAFIARLTAPSARAMLRDAGYEFDDPS
jgi:molybdate transport system substrate-binding protein